MDSAKDRYEFLASVWLQQQDLSDKSPVEIAELYFKAYHEINAKYHPKSNPKRQKYGVVSPGIKLDDEY